MHNGFSIQEKKKSPLYVFTVPPDLTSLAETIVEHLLHCSWHDLYHLIHSI